MSTVLVVDDNADACRMMARLVRRCGHHGEYATSGADALAFVRCHEVGLVVLDNMMPGMDGMEVLNRLRADPATAALPVVMWSAVNDPIFIERARLKGATDYWVKATINYGQLPAMLDRLLPGGRSPWRLDGCAQGSSQVGDASSRN